MQTSGADHEVSRSRFESALDRALREAKLDRDDALALLYVGSRRLDKLLGAASELRDRGHGRTITYSAKVFIPLTRLCRDECRYCTFRREPGDTEATALETDEAVVLARAGARLGAKEAMVSLGDKPESRFPEHRTWLAERGFPTTLDYVVAVCRRILDETPLFPHANPGLMAEPDLERLRTVTASVGLMLESVSERLLDPGQAHGQAPDKAPAERLRTIELAGKLRIPFTTGILIGIGETIEDRADALLAIHDLHERYGHIQEVIVQSFRAKAMTPLRHHPDLPLEDLLVTLAVARLLFGARANIQAPPNLCSEDYPELLRAGLNDWGGVSPLTPDHVNPEAPWPTLKALRDRTESAGFVLRERLAVYPEYIARGADFLDKAVREKLASNVDSEGLVPPKREAVRWS